MFLRFSLFKKIILWFFLNLAFLGAVFFLVFNVGFRPRLFGAVNRFEPISRLISSEVQNVSRPERDAVLRRYAEAYKVEFFIFDNDSGEQLAGGKTELPAEVARELRRLPPPAPPDSPEFKEFRGLPPGPPPIFMLRSVNPTLYWLGLRMPLFEKNNPEIHRATILIASDSSSGNGLFFDVTPWIFVLCLVVAASILFWLPFVRSLTRSISEMTDATAQIAEERFDVRVDDGRTDELGHLGKSINHLAARLSGFVTGQKRFLGDVSHELNSPLARMQFALGVLEDNTDASKRVFIEDVREEVELMAKLVDELLTFSKAGMKLAETKFETIRLRPIVETIVEREAEDAAVKIEIDCDLTVSANAELLARALANVVRNAVRYAGDAGEIRIAARQFDNQVEILISDCGAGVPDAALEKLFDPFYRLQSDRARKTGGTGLGLAIVKTCVESCGGKVFARNREPRGLKIVIQLKT